MSKMKVTRRGFLKLIGIGTAGTIASVPFSEKVLAKLSKKTLKKIPIKGRPILEINGNKIGLINYIETITDLKEINSGNGWKQSKQINSILIKITGCQHADIPIRPFIREYLEAKEKVKCLIYTKDFNTKCEGYINSFSYALSDINSMMDSKIELVLTTGFTS